MCATAKQERKIIPINSFSCFIPFYRFIAQWVFTKNQIRAQESENHRLHFSTPWMRFLPHAWVRKFEEIISNKHLIDYCHWVEDVKCQVIWGSFWWGETH